MSSEMLVDDSFHNDRIDDDDDDVSTTASIDFDEDDLENNVVGEREKEGERARGG